MRSQGSEWGVGASENVASRARRRRDPCEKVEGTFGVEGAPQGPAARTRRAQGSG